MNKLRSVSIIPTLLLFVALLMLGGCAKKDEITAQLPGLWTTSWDDETSEFEIDNLSADEFILFDEFDERAGHGEFVQYLKGEIEYSDFEDEAKIPYECGINGRWKVENGNEIVLHYDLSSLEVAVGNVDIQTEGYEMLNNLVNGDWGEMIFNAAIEGARQKSAKQKIGKDVERKVARFFSEYFHCMNKDEEAMTEVVIEGNILTCEVNAGSFNREAIYKRKDMPRDDNDDTSSTSATSSELTSSASDSGDAYVVPSLLDIVYDQDIVTSGEAKMNLLHIGKNYEKAYDEYAGSTSQELTVEGTIGNDNFTAECWLTEEGELHGRYHNANGTNLDLNGFVAPNGNLLIQLGHDSEASEWRLWQVASESTTSYHYEGTWGKRDKESYAVFRVK